MQEATEETAAEMWDREDRERAQMMKSAKLFAAWTAGWLIRKFFAGAAMALGGWLALHIAGVI